MRMTRFSEFLIVLVVLWFFLPVLADLRDFLMEGIGFGSSRFDPGELALMIFCVIVAGIVAIMQRQN